MVELYGWTGQILSVDLTTKGVTRLPTSDFEPDKYIGGVGLNTKIFWELGSPKVDAFHPDSPLMISVGPLTGAIGSFNRAECCGIAPHGYPEEVFSYSGAGGRFPAAFKSTGYDGIIITGKADKPVYLVITNNEVQIKDARELWGLDTFETQKRLLTKYPGSSALVIGPAGENLSRIAILLNDTANAFGQGGFGAVFGSKNLKAIVALGSGTFKIARPDIYSELISQVKAGKHWRIGKNQQWGREPLNSGIIRFTMMSYLIKYAGCYGCPYQCNGVYDIPGIGKGAQMCMEAWYGNFNGDSAEGMWEGNILSQKLGINNCELLGIMSFMQRAMAIGAITKADVGLSFIPMVDNIGQDEYGGLEAHHRFLEEFLNGIARGTSPFTQGAGRAARQFGARAIEVYESVFPAHGSRTHHIEGVGPALIWATDARDPFNSVHDSTECFARNASVAAYFGLRGGYLAGGQRQMIYEEAEKEAIWVQNHQSLKNSLTMCEYASYPDMYLEPNNNMDVRVFESKILSSVTGKDYSVETLWEAGERICNLRRAIMVLREGRLREDDTLSQFYFKNVGTTSEVLGAPLDKAQWEAAKDRYYKLRGWDIKTGRPARTKLESLGMKEVADKLQSAGVLG